MKSSRSYQWSPSSSNRAQLSLPSKENSSLSGLVSPRVMFGNDRFVEPGRAANLSARLSIFRIGDGCKRPTGHVARWDANRSHRGKQRPLDPQLP
jgi:hypothetical protein